MWLPSDGSSADSSQLEGSRAALAILAAGVNIAQDKISCQHFSSTIFSIDKNFCIGYAHLAHHDTLSASPLQTQESRKAIKTKDLPCMCGQSGEARVCLLRGVSIEDAG